MKPLILLAVAVCFFASGCDDSKNPLSDPQTSKTDERQVGVWRLRNSDGVGYYHIGQAGGKLPGSVMRVVEVTHSQKKLEYPHEYLVFPTTLGGKTYLSVTEGKEQQVKLLEEKGWKPEVVDSYYILKYQVDGDKLLVWTMDADAKKRAIESGKIKGVIEKKKDQYASTVKFIDTTENLARFVAEAGNGLFPNEPLRFEKVDESKKP